MPNIRALHHDDSLVLAKLPGKLAVSDVERVHPLRAGLEKHVGEAAGRRTDVERHGAACFDLEHPQRLLQFQAASADVRQRLAQQYHRAVDRYACCRLGDDGTVDGNAAPQNDRLRSGPRLREAALHHEHVESAGRHGRLGRGRAQTGPLTASGGGSTGPGDGSVSCSGLHPTVTAAPRAASHGSISTDSRNIAWARSANASAGPVTKIRCRGVPPAMKLHSLSTAASSRAVVSAESSTWIPGPISRSKMSRTMGKCVQPSISVSIPADRNTSSAGSSLSAMAARASAPRSMSGTSHDADACTTSAPGLARRMARV